MIHLLNKHQNVLNLGHIKTKFKEYLTRNLDYRSKQIINVFETCDSVTELF